MYHNSNQMFPHLPKHLEYKLQVSEQVQTHRHQSIHQELYELLVVEMPDTVASPGTVVVEPADTLRAGRAVVRAFGPEVAAPLALLHALFVEFGLVARVKLHQVLGRDVFKIEYRVVFGVDVSAQVALVQV